jgi:hypothetical protein
MTKPILIRFVLTLSLVLLFGVTSYGGYGVCTGRERGFWRADQHSVVVAKVLSDATHVETPSSKHYYKMSIEPVATLAGAFDVSRQAKIEVGFYIGGPNIDHAPPKDAFILIVLEQPAFIISDDCEFMPDHSALVIVDGLSDRRVHETLDKIRDARAHADPEE